MVAAVSKIMRVQDLVTVAAKRHVITRFRDTLGLPGRMATRLQPNHPTDDPRGIAASIVDGLMYGSGDAVIGVNPATDDVNRVETLLRMLDHIRETLAIPTQTTCVLAHVTTQMEALRRGAPVDLMFQSIAGTEDANRAFGITLAMLDEACQATRELKRSVTPGVALSAHVMYFETRTRQRAFGERRIHVGSTSRPARRARLCRRPQIRSAPGEYGGGVHWTRVPV